MIQDLDFCKNQKSVASHSQFFLKNTLLSLSIDLCFGIKNFRDFIWRFEVEFEADLVSTLYNKKSQPTKQVLTCKIG